MQDKHPHVGLSRFCRLLGISRQAYYQHFWQERTRHLAHELVLREVKRIRINHPYIGTRKLYQLLGPFLTVHQLKLGRDALFNLLAANKLLVRRKKRRICTTNSFHWLKKYPNLIEGFIPDAIEQLWVSDITYWKIKEQPVYISFITDAYSHKIVGYQLAETLQAVESVQALKMALSGVLAPAANLIHHSDRGIQYYSQSYVELLEQHNIKISMTQTGDPLDNAIAERVNGIIKNEYLCSYQLNDFQQAKLVLDFVIQLYNEERPHMSIGNLTPQHVHDSNAKTARLWKNYYHNNKNHSHNNTKLVNLYQDQV